MGMEKLKQMRNGEEFSLYLSLYTIILVYIKEIKIQHFHFNIL